MLEDGAQGVVLERSEHNIASVASRDYYERGKVAHERHQKS